MKNYPACKELTIDNVKALLLTEDKFVDKFVNFSQLVITFVACSPRLFVFLGIANNMDMGQTAPKRAV